MYTGYYNNIVEAKKLRLTGTTLMVYSTLRFLCKKQPWKKNETQLADMSGCGSYMTAKRGIDRLLKMRLFATQIVDDTTQIVYIGTTQNVDDTTQNVDDTTQNVDFSKEKKYQEKENINKENKIKQQCGSVNARESELSPTQKEKVMLQILGIKDKVPGSTGLYKEVIRFGYLQPKQYINAMYDHYNTFGRKVVDHFAAIRAWMRKEVKNYNPPALNEQEIAYLSTFLDAIEQRAVVRICDLLTCFELTDKYAIFTMKLTPEKIRDMDNWIAEHIDKNQIEPYNRAITYKVAQ